MTAVCIDTQALCRMLPLVVQFDSRGRVERVGPTIEKIASGMPGRFLANAIRFVHLPLAADVSELLACSGRKLRVELVDEADVPPGEERVQFRGIVIPLTDGGGLLTLSLGTDPRLALRRHKLTARDFTEADPMVDFLYLAEAHDLLLSEFGRMSGRLEKARAAAHLAAVTDKLTGLHNRRAMDDRLSALTKTEGVKFGLMQLDLDFFKKVNDTMGHAAGDRVLEEVAKILQDEIRSEDMVARVGGDEFMLVFADCVDIELLQKIAARIIARIELPIDWQGQQCRISGSIGITLSSYYDRPDADRMVSDVDTALYESKHTGRAKTSIARPVRAA